MWTTKQVKLIQAKKVINEKAHSDLDGDFLVSDFDNFLESIAPTSIVEKITTALIKINSPKEFKQEVDDLVTGLMIYINSFDDCITELRNLSKEIKLEKELDNIMEDIRLYRVGGPFVALASNYGVPQNRERVLFIGCRKDQKLIREIPPSVTAAEKVTVFEALYDLDFVGNDGEVTDYEEVDIKAKFNGTSAKMQALLRKRAIDGKPLEDKGRTFAEWSKVGRLNGRFDLKAPVYVRTADEYKNIDLCDSKPLQNHKTSKQNEDVIKRLDVILKEGNYDDAKIKLKKLGLESDKRSYNVLKPSGQSPTVLTMPDDYIHYASPRALTVREMARLQSFDDSFVFQGKRSTGGDKRKSEVPQYTLVGNAIPPLMARAIAMEVLKFIN